MNAEFFFNTITGALDFTISCPSVDIQMWPIMIGQFSPRHFVVLLLTMFCAAEQAATKIFGGGGKPHQVRSV